MSTVPIWVLSDTMGKKKTASKNSKDLFTALEPRKLYLLDGMALIYRAHFGLIRSPRFTSGGTPTSAVFGIANTVLDIIKRQKPTHIAMAFDTSDPTFRHEAFAEYKAQRDALPEDIAVQIPLVDRLMKAMNIGIIRMPGYEADDIIGTLALQAADQGYDVWMVTPDKDYHQLARENVSVYKPGRQGNQFELMGIPEVIEKWQIERVEQVIDILGLMGDKSDNVPGIPGIGEKTAQKLSAQFDSVEKLIESTDQLKGKQKERVEENREMAIISKKLVTIKTDVPHDLAIDEFEMQDHVTDELKDLFMELEFDSLGKKMFGSSFVSAHQGSSDSWKAREGNPVNPVRRTGH